MRLPRFLRRPRKRKPEAVPGFDPVFYAARYPDVPAHGWDPLEHYLVFGRGELRDPNPGFDAARYARTNPEVAASGLDPLTHFLQHGMAAGYTGWQRYPARNGTRTDPAPSGPLDEPFAAFVQAEIDSLEEAVALRPDDDGLRETLDDHWFHASRWIMTLKALGPLLREGDRVLDIGNGSMVSAFLAQRGWTVAQAYGDLREPLKGIASEAHDIVLCLEVIEHIKDREGDPEIDRFTGSGVRGLVSEMFRALRPGGIVLCTTPNGCASSSIARALLMEPPMFSRDHVREFSPRELTDRFREAGFSLVSLATPPDPWPQRDDLDIGTVEALIARAGGRTDLREDDIVAVFRKP